MNSVCACAQGRNARALVGGGFVRELTAAAATTPASFGGGSGVFDGGAFALGLCRCVSCVGMM